MTSECERVEGGSADDLPEVWLEKSGVYEALTDVGQDVAIAGARLGG